FRARTHPSRSFGFGERSFEVLSDEEAFHAAERRAHSGCNRAEEPACLAGGLHLDAETDDLRLVDASVVGVRIPARIVEPVALRLLRFAFSMRVATGAEHFDLVVVGAVAVRDEHLVPADA